MAAGRPAPYEESANAMPAPSGKAKVERQKAKVKTEKRGLLILTDEKPAVFHRQRLMRAALSLIFNG